MSKLEATFRVAQPLIPGENIQAIVELNAASQVSVEWVDVTLEGEARWHTGSGKSRRSRRELFVHQKARIVENVTLHGASAYTVRFALDASLPSTFAHANAHVTYTARATASIPWAFDSHWSWTLHTDARGPIDVRPRPLILRRTDGVELSLERDAFGRGDVVRGRIAWPTADAPREVQIVFREVVGLIGHAGHVSERIGRAFGIPVAIDPHAPEGSAFEFRLPDDVICGFRTNVVQLRWELCVQRVQRGMLWDSRSDELKTHVVISAQPISKAPLELAPPVGDARLLAMSNEVAAQLGWSASDEGVSREVALRGQALSAHVVWQRRAQMMLSAEVSFPSVGLSLRVSPSSLMQRMLEQDIAVGEPAWDAAHWVEGREAAQVRAFLSPIVQFTRQHQLTLAHVDDDSLTLECVDNQVSTASLHRFLSLLDQLLATLPLTMSQVPTPELVRVDLPHALRVAEQLNGLFVPGFAGFHGTLPSGHAITSRVHFGEDRKPERIEVVVEGLTEGTLAIDAGRQATNLPGGVQSLLLELDEDVRVRMEEGRATATVTGLTEPFMMQPERVMQLGTWLVRAARALGESGAFR